MEEELAVYKRYAERERKARKAAELLLEQKAEELFDANQQLKELNQNLEVTVQARTYELSQANARLKTLVSNLNAGLLAEDERRHIILTNQRFCDMFNMPVGPQDLLGQDCSNFAENGKLMFKDPDQFVERLDVILRDKKLVVADQLETVDGRILERDYIPIQSDGHYYGHLWQYREITTRVRAEQELSKARKHAEAAVEAREQFLANMSHEIRTPMNSILGMSELLLKEELDQRHRNFLSIMHDSASNLLVVINDILDISKIDSGKLQFEKIGFALSDLERNLIGTISNQAEKKDLEIIQDRDSSLPAVVIGDPYRLSQVLLNLLSNAIKFTDKGYLKVGIKEVATTADSVRVRFSVKDTGVGISEEKMVLIFEEFAQEDASVTRKYGGTGLGLTISSKLVQLMGGEISVESKVGKGTTFSFELEFPIGSAENLPVPVTNSAGKEKLAGKRLLLVEDHPYNQQLALAIMEDWNMDITVAENGVEALACLEKATFDFVLMDVQMPVMDGIEATRLIRQRFGPSLPIIALTANALRSQEASLRSGGMDGYLSKPFRAEELLAEVIRVLKLGDAPKSEPIIPAAPVAPAGPLYDRAALERQTGGDPRMTQRMLDIFLEMTPGMVKDFKTAVDSRNLRKLENLAHKLKPSVRLMGMHQILEETLRLETASAQGVPTEEAIALVNKLVAHLEATYAAIKAES